MTNPVDDDPRYFTVHVLVTGETYGGPIDLVLLANFIQRCVELDGSSFKDDQPFRIVEVSI